jgi:hypothetical protein
MKKFLTALTDKVSVDPILQRPSANIRFAVEFHIYSIPVHFPVGSTIEVTNGIGPYTTNGLFFSLLSLF